jgi:hypothetical protein
VTIDGHDVTRVHVVGSEVTAELGHQTPGRHRVQITVADFQELKNSENADARPLPNTRVAHFGVTVR